MATLNGKAFPEDLHNINKKSKRRSPFIDGIETAEKMKTSIMQLRGLGKKHWKGVNITKFIDEERESWK